jgi:hypothetical protein
MIVAGYVVSGISKLIASGGRWVFDLPNIALQLRKNVQAEYYNTLEQAAAPAGEKAVQLVVDYPIGAMIFFGIGLALELFAFAALFNRWIMALWGLGLIGLHVGVSELMQLGFFFNKTLLLLFFVNVPFWICAIAARGKRKL